MASRRLTGALSSPFAGQDCRRPCEFQPKVDFALSSGQVCLPMFNDILDSIQASENVLGVCLLDENGVCLGTRGRLTTVSMDRSTDLPALILASALKPKADQRAPFAIVWDQHASMHISQNARLTLAVLKRAP